MLIPQNNQIRLFDPILTDEMKSAAMDALENDIWSDGEYVSKFEEKFADFVGAKYAVATSSGTSAIYSSIMALNAISGVSHQKIITSPFGFITSANSIVLSQNIPQFIDIDEDLNLLPNIEKHLSSIKNMENIGAIMPVCMHGHKTDIDKIQSFCAEQDLHMVTDACQFHAKGTGVVGDAMCYSFYPTKNMTICMDGGMIVTDDERIRDLAKSITDCGRTPSISRYMHRNFGLTMRMSSIGAAIGIEQLKHLDDWNKIRKRNAMEYLRCLQNTFGIRLPTHCTDESVWYVFEIRTKSRNLLSAHLKNSSPSINTGIHFPIPINRQSVYQGYADKCPVSKNIADTTLSLPVHPNISIDDIKYICDIINGCIENLHA